MKILYAECCGTLIVPDNQADTPRWCDCGKSSVWWIDPRKGILGIYSVNGIPGVSVIGLNNSLLREPFTKMNDGREYGCIQGTIIKRLIEETPQSYVFKQVESLVIRVRPGFTNDVKFFESLDSIPNSS